MVSFSYVPKKKSIKFTHLEICDGNMWMCLCLFFKDLDVQMPLGHLASYGPVFMSENIACRSIEISLIQTASFEYCKYSMILLMHIL